MKISFIIPCYKVNSINQIIEKLLSFKNLCMIYLIDDACPFNSLDKLNISKKIVLLKNKKNMGMGYSIKKALPYAINDKSDLIFKIDGDGQMNLDYIEKFISLAKEDKNISLIKGNRFINNNYNNIPFIRFVGSIILSLINKVSSGYVNIFDSENGFIMFYKKNFNFTDIDYLHNRFFFHSDLIAYCFKNELKISDIPLKAIYDNQIKSTLKIKKIILIFLFQHFKNYVKRIISYGYKVLSLLFIFITFVYLYYPSHIIWFFVLFLFIDIVFCYIKIKKINKNV